MDELQRMMEANEHLSEPDKVQQQMWSISKFWSILSEEDKDYLHCASDALETKMEWKV